MARHVLDAGTTTSNGRRLAPYLKIERAAGGTLARVARKMFRRRKPTNVKAVASFIAIERGRQV